MYRQETIKPYSTNGEKARQVETMFDNIAPTYDKLNHRLSWDIDRSWRRKAIKALEPYMPQQILDVATGTGDFAIMTAQMLKPQHITGCDISEGMMKVARQRVEKEQLDKIISFHREDCSALSYPDASFDAVTSAFGIRNFQDLDKSLLEIHRVLKPGGRISIVELSQPVSFPMRQLFAVYSHCILPVYGRIISKDKAAYSYLTKTIEAFPQGEQMTVILKKAGFTDVSFKRFTFGICTLYTAGK